jgi:hypothetical protein
MHEVWALAAEIRRLNAIRARVVGVTSESRQRGISLIE